MVHPVSVCLIVGAVIAVLSNLLRGQLDEAYDTAHICLISLLYYMLLVCLVRTPAGEVAARVAVVDTCILAGLGVADYRGIIHIPSLSVVMEAQYVGGVEMPLRRLGGTSNGMFGDPNDFGLLIASCILYSFYLLGDRSAVLARARCGYYPCPCCCMPCR